MLFATKTVGATRGGAGGGVGVAVGVGMALAVADTVARGLVDGAEPAAGVPQAASNAGTIKVSSTFLIIRFITSITRILLASEIFRATEIYTWPGYSHGSRLDRPGRRALVRYAARVAGRRLPCHRPDLPNRYTDRAAAG